MVPGRSQPPGADVVGRSGAPDVPLAHVDAAGRARMVDVTSKPWTRRRARAGCRVRVAAADDVAIASGPESSTTWPELLTMARFAGIQAAKQTAVLIPLCHPLTISNVDVQLSMLGGCVEIKGIAEVEGPTGVEMEALTACTVAALTIVAAVSPTRSGVAIEDLELWEKSGGRSGTWFRSDGAAPGAPR